MKKQDEQLQNLYQDVTIPPPDQKVKKQTLSQAGILFEQEKKKNVKKIKGSLNENRLMVKIFTTINKLLGGPEMTKRYALIGTAAIAIMVGVSIFQQQNNLLTIPEGLVKSSPDQKFKVLLKDTEIGTLKQSAEPKTPKAVLGDESNMPQEFAVGASKGDNDDRVSDSFKSKAEAESLSMQVPSSQPTRLATMERRGDLPGKKIEGVDRTMSSAAPQRTRISRRTYLSEQRSNYGYDQYTGRDKFQNFTVNPTKSVIEEPLSTFSIDVDTASYAFMRRSLKNGLLPQKNSVRIEELINYFDYDYAVPKDRTQPFKPTIGVYQTPWNPQTKIMHIGIKGYDIVDQQKPKANLVFLIDVSGSMSSPDKLPLLKNSLRMLVDTLQEKDSVALVVYAGAAGVVLDPTSVSEKGKITAALDKLQSGGSTAGGAGIRLAYNLAEANIDKNGVNRVILATDGDFNVGITNQEELKSYIEKKRKSGISLSVLGFGQGNYNDSLMQILAQHGNGNASYIDTLSEARKVLVDEASSTLFTIATDVKIQVEFNPSQVAEYRLIGYETRVLNKEEFNNDKVDAGDIGSGHSVTALYEITPVGSREKLIDDLRYQQKQSAKTATVITKNESEYGFLKLRYKLPGESTSKLITMPVDYTNDFGAVEKAPDEMKFAASVSAFGQIIRNDSSSKDFNYDDVINLANSSKGTDPYGYRSEFVSLVRLAKTARGM